MNNWLYLSVNLFVVLGPLLLIFLTKSGRKHYLPQLPKYLLSLTPIAIGFILWDIFAVEARHWDFNPEFILGIKFAGLALEEYLFFFTVPFALLFTYQCVLRFISGKFEIKAKTEPKTLVAKAKTSSYVWLTAVLSTVSLIISFSLTGYTQLVVIAFAITLALILIINPSLLRSKSFWAFMTIQFGLFFLTNLILTALPVITYGETAILGARVITIPVEDFIYSFCLTALNILIFSKLLPMKLNKYKVLSIGVFCYWIFLIGFAALDSQGLFGEDIGLDASLATSSLARVMFMDIGGLSSLVAAWMLFSSKWKLRYLFACLSLVAGSFVALPYVAFWLWKQQASVSQA